MENPSFLIRSFLWGILLFFIHPFLCKILLFYGVFILLYCLDLSRLFLTQPFIPETTDHLYLSVFDGFSDAFIITGNEPLRTGA